MKRWMIVVAAISLFGLAGGLISLPGDFNGDGVVDLTDLQTFQANYRTFSDTFDLDEENDADSFVESHDAAVFSYHFGRSEETASLSVPDNLEIGDSIFVTVTDPDENELIKSADTVTVTVTNLKTGETEVFVLTESGLRTGVFITDTGLPTSGNVADSVSNSGTLYVQNGDSGTVVYADDDEPADTQFAIFTVGVDTSIGAGTPTKSILVVASDLWVPNFPLGVFVDDKDQNQNPAVFETVTVTVTNLRTGETELLLLTELTANADTFAGELVNSSDTGESVSLSGTMWVVAGDTVLFVYIDPTDATDTAFDTVSFINNTPSSVTVEDSVVPGFGVTITVNDADQNIDPGVVDTVVVTIVNNRTGESEVLVLQEITANNGTFDTNMKTSTNSADSVSGNGIIFTQPSDSLTAFYTDPDFPADSAMDTGTMNPMTLPSFVAGLRVATSAGTGTIYNVANSPLDNSNEVIRFWIDAIDADGTIVNKQLLDWIQQNLGFGYVQLEVTINGQTNGWKVLTFDSVIFNPEGAEWRISDTQAEILDVQCTTAGFVNNVSTNQGTKGTIQFVNAGTIVGDLFRDNVFIPDNGVVTFTRAVDSVTKKRLSSTGSFFRLDHTSGDNFTIKRLLPGTFDLFIEPLVTDLTPDFNGQTNLNIATFGGNVDIGSHQLNQYADRGSIDGTIVVKGGGTPTANGIDQMVAFLSWEDSTLPNTTPARLDAGDGNAGFGSVNDYDFPPKTGGVDIAPRLKSTADSSYYINIIGLDVDGYRLFLSQPQAIQVQDNEVHTITTEIRQVNLLQAILFINSLPSYDSTNVAPTYNWQFVELDPDNYFFTIEVTDRSDSVYWKVTGIPEGVNQAVYGVTPAGGTVVVPAQPLLQEKLYKFSVRAGLAANPQVDIQNFIFSYNTGSVPDTSLLQGNFTSDSFVDYLNNLDDGIAALQAMTEEQLTQLAQTDPEELLEYDPVTSTGQEVTEGAFFVTRQKIIP